MKKSKLLLSLLLIVLTVAIVCTLVTVSASGAPDPIKYIDENGEEQTCTNPTLLTDQTAWTDGNWYVVTNDVTLSNVTVTGDVKLILCDGATLTAAGSSYDISDGHPGICVTEGNTLTVYGQEEGTGTLTATGTSNGAGIGGYYNMTEYEKPCGKVVINGGTVMATGGPSGAGIGSADSDGTGEIVINGGTVTAVGGTDSAGIGTGTWYSFKGTVTITGGTVTAVGNDCFGIGGQDNEDEVFTLTISRANVTVVTNINTPYTDLSGSPISLSVSGVTVKAGADESSLSDVVLSDTNVRTALNTYPYTTVFTAFYSYEFDAGEGSVVETKGTDTVLPSVFPTPVYDGHDFLGWYTDEALTKEAVPGAALTKDTTVYAKWAETGAAYQACVRELGNRRFSSLADAFTSVNKTKETMHVTLLSDVCLSGSLSLDASTDVVFDLNGKTVTLDDYHYSSGVFTIQGKAVFLDSVGGGTIHNKKDDGGAIFFLSADTADLTIVSGSYLADNGMSTMQKNFMFSANGKLTINGGTFFYQYTCLNVMDGIVPTITVNGGVFKKASTTGKDYFLMTNMTSNNVTVNAAVVYGKPTLSTDYESDYKKNWNSRIASGSSYTEIADADGVTCYRIAPTNTTGTLYLKNGNVYADDQCTALTYYPGISSFEETYYFSDLTMTHEDTCLYFSDDEAHVCVLGQCTLTSTNADNGAYAIGTVGGYDVVLENGNGTLTVINSTDNGKYAVMGHDVSVFGPTKLYMTAKGQVTNANVCVENCSYFYSKTYNTAKDDLTMGTVEASVVQKELSHLTMFIGDPLPVFDDRFDGKVTKQNYDSFTSATNAYVASKGYVFQGWYTGIDGRGEKLTTAAVNGTAYYAFYKTADGRPVVTTPLDLTDVAVQTAYTTAINGIQWTELTLDAPRTLILSNVVIDVSGSDDFSAIHLYDRHEILIYGKVDIVVREASAEGEHTQTVRGLYLSAQSTRCFSVIGKDKDAALSIQIGDFHNAFSFGIDAATLAFTDVSLTVKTGKLIADDPTSNVINAALSCSSSCEFNNCRVSLVAGSFENANEEDSYSYGFYGYSSSLKIEDTDFFATGYTKAVKNFTDYAMEFVGVDVCGSASYNDTAAKGKIYYVNRLDEKYVEEYLTGGQAVRSLVTSVHYEAAIGSTKYTTLEKALKNAQTNDTVKLLRDVLLKKTLHIDEELSVTIDLNGHVLGKTNSLTSLPLLAMAPGMVGAKRDYQIIVNDGVLTLTDTGDSTAVHYVASDGEGNAWILTPGDLGFDLDNMIFVDPYGVSYDDEIPVQKFLGGLLGPNHDSAVKNNNTFIMTSGTIGACAGAVLNEVDEAVPTFTMNGGKITGCIAPRAIRAYFMSSSYCVTNYGVFVMNGGEISGNAIGGVQNATEYDYGNECPLSGTGVFKMFGGKIENNVGAGVYAEEGSTVVLGGKLSVTGNTKDDKAYNLVLCEDVTVSYDGQKPLDTASVIGVSTVAAPTATSPVVFTATSTADYTKTFVSDVALCLVRVKEAATVLELLQFTQQPASGNDYEIKANATDVTLEWRKVLDDIVISDADVMIEWENWTVDGKLMYLNSNNGLISGKTFTSDEQELMLCFNLLRVKVGDVFYFDSAASLKVDDGGDVPGKLENLGNGVYRLTLLSIEQNVYLVPDGTIEGEFTITNLRIPQSAAVTGQTAARLGDVTEDGEYFCRMYRGDAFVDSDSVSTTVVSYASGEATGTVPTDVVSLAGRKITLPENPFTKTGNTFCGWQISGTTYAAKAEYTVPAADATLTAVWKTTVVLSQETYEPDYDGESAEYTLAGQDKTLTDFVISYYVDGDWTTDAPVNVGTYNVKVTRAETETYASFEMIVTGGIVIHPAAVSEPTVSGEYKYTGQEQTVQISGKETFMTESGTVKATNAGTYTVTYTLDDNHVWAEGSDGVVTWVIKAVKLDSSKDENEKSDVVVKTDDGFPVDVTLRVEVTVEAKVTESGLTVNYYDLPVEELKLARNEKVGVVFDVKLIRTVGGESVEIQPEDIAPGTTVRVLMHIPDDVDVDKITRILHVHSADKISEIDFDVTKVTADRYYEIEISELSEFAFVYAKTCINHWFMLALLLLFAAYIALLYVYMKKRTHDLFTVIGCAVFALTELLFFLFRNGCGACLALFLISLVVLLLAVLLFFADKLKGMMKKQPVEEKTAPAEEPVTKTAAPVAAAVAEEKGLSLSDAMERVNAITVDNIALNKQSIADFLEENFAEGVVVNRRENYITSGILPLADTHYAVKNGKKICFLYVYELRDGKVFCLAKCDDRIAKEIAAKHPSFVPSAFPKTSRHDWHTLFIDDSYASSADVLGVIATLYANVSDTERVEVLRRVDVKTAHNRFENAEIEKIIEETSSADGRRNEAKGPEAIINVDTLSESFSDGDEITIDALKAKNLISKNAARLKVLARGELDKKFTVVADTYSLDAAKMIVAVGGSVIRLRK